MLAWSVGITEQRDKHPEADGHSWSSSVLDRLPCGASNDVFVSVDPTVAWCQQLYQRRGEKKRIHRVSVHCERKLEEGCK